MRLEEAERGTDRNRIGRSMGDQGPALSINDVGPVHETTQAAQHLVRAAPGGQVFLTRLEREDQRGLEPSLGRRPGDFHQALVELELESVAGRSTTKRIPQPQ